MAITLSLLATLFAQAQQIDQTFSGIAEVEISTGSSDCLVQKGSGDQVNVKLEHTYGDDFKPSVEKSGDKLVIKENNTGSSRGNATWTLTVPDGLEFEFNSGSGNFKGSDLEIELSMNSGSGDFNLDQIRGEIESNSGSGDLEVDDFSGEIESNSGSGDLTVDNASGEIELNTGSGDIELSNLNAAIEANSGSGDIEADNVILAGTGDFNSGSGNVEVRLAESPGHNISVNSGSGDALLDFQGNDIVGTVIMTANKKNGTIEAPFSFDEEEEIDQGSGQPTIRKTARFGDSDVQIRVGTGSGEARIE